MEVPRDPHGLVLMALYYLLALTNWLLDNKTETLIRLYYQSTLPQLGHKGLPLPSWQQMPLLALMKEWPCWRGSEGQSGLQLIADKELRSPVQQLIRS